MTGAGGFLGRHVLRSLASSLTDITVHGLDLPHVVQPGNDPDCVHHCDLSDLSAVRNVMAKIHPETVIHLAGLIQSNDSEALHRANVTATKNLLAFLPNPPGHLIQISSSAVYGVPEVLPVAETHPLAPVSPYGESMVDRENVVRIWARDTNIRLTLLRLFNISGPGQAPGMMVPAFARQIALIEAGMQEPHMTVGRLDTYREIMDVRDVANAVAASVGLLATTQREQILNVCTGESRQGQEILDLLLGLATTHIEVEQIMQEGRSTDVMDIRGDSTNIGSSLDWSPQFSLETTLRDVLDDWRQRISATDTA